MRLFLASADGGHHPDPKHILTLTLTLPLTLILTLNHRHAWWLCRAVVVLGNILVASGYYVWVGVRAVYKI